MKLFDFFKGKKEEREPTREKYWSLSTSDGEIVDPKIKQIEQAVKNATSNISLFATLAYNYSGLEIESVQTISNEGFYRFEALTTNGKMYVKNDIDYDEALELFKQFYKHQRVSRFKTWLVEKY